MTKRTKATSISGEVKRIVYARDNGECIFCHSPGNPEAHVLPRSKGGLGVEENVVTVCRMCHELMDNSPYRAHFLEVARNHLRKFYEEDAVIKYSKGGIG